MVTLGFQYGSVLVFELKGVTRVATLTIKNVPDPLVRKLKNQATLHRRSLNHEVIACLETAAQAVPVNPEVLLARVRAVRRTPRGLRLTDRVLNSLKASGRA